MPDSVSSGSLSLSDGSRKKMGSRWRNASGHQGSMYDHFISTAISLSSSTSIEEMLEVFSRRMPLLINYDMGTIRWKGIGDEGDDWDQDPEDDFSESRSFVAESYVLSGAREIDIQGDIECDLSDSPSRGMEAVCRARTQSGDPVIIRLRSALVVPLYDEDERIGVLSLYSSREGAFEDEDSEFPPDDIWKMIGSSLGRILEFEHLRKETSRAEKLLSSTDEIIVVWRRDGTVWEIDCNERAEDFIHRPDITPELMEGPFFAPPGKEWERAMLAWTAALESGESSQLDMELLSRKAERIPYICTFSPLMESGEIIGVRMTGSEVSTMDRSMETVMRSATGNRLLLSILTHDLKNPLSAIYGYSELAQLSEGAKKDDYIDRVLSSTRKMMHTLEMVKVLSQIQEGKLEREFKLLDISALVDQSMEALQPRVEDYEVSLKRRGKNFKLMCHELMEEVLVNLIDNAMKYSPTGSSIAVDLAADLEGVTISIGDQGQGIPDELKDAVFQRFQRGINKESSSGSGLGLAICKGIVELHRGRIWVEDNKPVGSVFRIKLPWS
ncbi:MAG: ATP-binding protein [Thermoplasmatota archaeon]